MRDERNSLIQSLYGVCMAYKAMQTATQHGDENVEAALDDMDKAINELCRTVGLNRKFLEQDCY